MIAGVTPETALRSNCPGYLDCADRREHGEDIKRAPPRMTLPRHRGAATRGGLTTLRDLLLATTTRRRRAVSRPTLAIEAAADGVVCGIDEVGVSPLAGPVVAAAVVLPKSSRRPRSLAGLTDSKQLSAGERERLATAVRKIAAVGIGAASAAEIDRLNIYHATMLAMRRAFARLPEQPDLALVDGTRAPDFPCAVQKIVKGDTKSLSIAAASVVAKVTRDRLMHRLHSRYPRYGWQSNVGYGTDEHYLGLLRHGPTIHHRRSFSPVTRLFKGVDDHSEASPAGPDLVERAAGLGVLRLREDLYAVFDDRQRHIGVLKAFRGQWRIRALAYDEQENLLLGEGPLAPWHEQPLPRPDEMILAGLLRAS